MAIKFFRGKPQILHPPKPSGNMPRQSMHGSSSISGGTLDQIYARNPNSASTLNDFYQELLDYSKQHGASPALTHLGSNLAGIMGQLNAKSKGLELDEAVTRHFPTQLKAVAQTLSDLKTGAVPVHDAGLRAQAGSLLGQSALFPANSYLPRQPHTGLQEFNLTGQRTLQGAVRQDKAYSEPQLKAIKEVIAQIPAFLASAAQTLNSYVANIPGGYEKAPIGIFKLHGELLQSQLVLKHYKQDPSEANLKALLQLVQGIRNTLKAARIHREFSPEDQTGRTLGDYINNTTPDTGLPEGGESTPQSATPEPMQGGGAEGNASFQEDFYAPYETPYAEKKRSRQDEIDIGNVVEEPAVLGLSALGGPLGLLAGAFSQSVGFGRVANSVLNLFHKKKPKDDGTGGEFLPDSGRGGNILSLRDRLKERFAQSETGQAFGGLRNALFGVSDGTAQSEATEDTKDTEVESNRRTTKAEKREGRAEGKWRAEVIKLLKKIAKETKAGGSGLIGSLGGIITSAIHGLGRALKVVLTGLFGESFFSRLRRSFGRRGNGAGRPGEGEPGGPAGKPGEGGEPGSGLRDMEKGAIVQDSLNRGGLIRRAWRGLSRTGSKTFEYVKKAGRYLREGGDVAEGAVATEEVGVLTEVGAAIVTAIEALALPIAVGVLAGLGVHHIVKNSKGIIQTGTRLLESAVGQNSLVMAQIDAQKKGKAQHLPLSVPRNIEHKSFSGTIDRNVSTQKVLPVTLLSKGEKGKAITGTIDRGTGAHTVTGAPGAYHIFSNPTLLSPQTSSSVSAQQPVDWNKVSQIIGKAIKDSLGTPKATQSTHMQQGGINPAGIPMYVQDGGLMLFDLGGLT